MSKRTILVHLNVETDSALTPDEIAAAILAGIEIHTDAAVPEFPAMTVTAPLVEEVTEQREAFRRETTATQNMVADMERDGYL